MKKLNKDMKKLINKKIKLILLFLCILFSSCNREDIFVDENYKIKTEWTECNNQYYLKLIYNNINYCFIIKLDFSNNWNISLIEQKDNIDYWYPIYLQKFDIKNKEEIMNYININFRKIIYDIKNKSISKKELLKAYNL